MLGGRDLEALHPRRQGDLSVGLDDEVEVRALDAEVDDPEVLAARRGERRLADRLVGEPAAQVADVPDDAQHDVDRMPRGELGPYLVRRPGPRLALATRAPLAATLRGRREQRQLLGLRAPPRLASRVATPRSFAARHSHEVPADRCSRN
jgi:hypothetical protein